MRRAAPTAGLSPQLLKHFAIATVAVTALLALFATEANWGAQAQLEATAANNRLAAAEAEKLGARRLEAKLKIKRRSGGSMASDVAADSGSGGGGGGGSGYYPDPPARLVAEQRPGPMRPPEFGGGGAGPRDDRSTAPRKQEKKRAPTEAELEAMLEASRQRSGSEGLLD
jgi:hypothetical protein